MSMCSELRQAVSEGGLDGIFAQLYPSAEEGACRRRYRSLLDDLESTFGDRPAVLISAPGRTEVGGNHTDHQHGNVLAAAVDLDIAAAVSPNGEPVIRVKSEGYPVEEIAIDDLSPRKGEEGTSAALIRGMAAWFADHAVEPVGFDLCATSDVLSGSGLSSSAAYEVLLGNAVNCLSGDSASAVDIAIAGQYAENRYFGKPSGLMDQMASSVGGFVQIDFADTAAPLIRPVRFDLAAHGYQLCIVDTGGSHADLTGEYAAITEEMTGVAKWFSRRTLREVPEEDFRRQLVRLREDCGDRAVLRALHFYLDDRLAVESAAALEAGDVEWFLQNVTRSGRSSQTCLQNIYAITSPREQGLGLALAISEQLLGGQGACRVHGGGFAGTIQAFVPDHLLESYQKGIETVFGLGTCHVLRVRPVGGCIVSRQINGGI